MFKTFLKRAPLAAVLVLSLSVVLDGLGYTQFSSLLRTLFDFVLAGYLDPEVAAGLVAGAGATYKFVQLVLKAVK